MAGTNSPRRAHRGVDPGACDRILHGGAAARQATRQRDHHRSARHQRSADRQGLLDPARPRRPRAGRAPPRAAGPEPSQGPPAFPSSAPRPACASPRSSNSSSTRCRARPMRSRTSSRIARKRDEELLRQDPRQPRSTPATPIRTSIRTEPEWSTMTSTNHDDVEVEDWDDDDEA